jgi:hypothetical protein
VAELTALGMTVARTDEHGTIAIAWAEDGRLQITSERQEVGRGTRGDRGTPAERGTRAYPSQAPPWLHALGVC